MALINTAERIHGSGWRALTRIYATGRQDRNHSPLICSSFCSHKPVSSHLPSFPSQHHRLPFSPRPTRWAGGNARSAHIPATQAANQPARVPACRGLSCFTKCCCFSPSLCMIGRLIRISALAAGTSHTHTKSHIFSVSPLTKMT